MTWTQRIKRVFNIDIETCPKCAGKVRIIASIEPHGHAVLTKNAAEDPKVIKKILHQNLTKTKKPGLKILATFQKYIFLAQSLNPLFIGMMAIRV